jgi:hypothetical protein
MNSKVPAYAIAFILQLLPIAPANAQSMEGGIRLGNMEQAAAADQARGLAAQNLFGWLAHVAVQQLGYDAAVATLAYNYQVEEETARELIEFLRAAQATYSAGADALMLAHCRAYDETLPGMSFETALATYQANKRARNEFSIRYYTDVLNGVRREFDSGLVRRIDEELNRRLANGKFGDLSGDPEDLQRLINRITELCAAIRARNGL